MLREQHRQPFEAGKGSMRKLQEIRQHIMPRALFLLELGDRNRPAMQHPVREADVIATDLEHLIQRIGKRSEDFKRRWSMLSIREKGFDDIAERLERILTVWEADRVSKYVCGGLVTFLDRQSEPFRSLFESKTQEVYSGCYEKDMIFQMCCTNIFNCDVLSDLPVE